MKGLFNKFKDQVNNLVKALDIETPSPGLGINSDPTLGNMDPDDPSRRKGSTDRKFRPQSRIEIAKQSIDSDKFFKLFQTMESYPEQKDEEYENTQFSLYTKEHKRSISSIFYEKVQNSEKIDIGSQEIFDLITSSQESTIRENKPLVLISIIGFHHKKGTVLEYSYPNLYNDLGFTKDLSSYIEQALLTAGMPDAVHNAPEDFVYFTVNVNKKQLENIAEDNLLKNELDSDHVVLYGISFFKQIPVTEAMKKKDPELIRSHVQKAICILSKAPIFGHILAKLDPVTKCYFTQDNFDDTQILRNAYDGINTSLKDVNINTNELLAGVHVKKLIYFLQEKAMILWKALFLERKILVYSQHPSACSTFIHSLLALFPCLCHFTYQNKALNLIENHYNEYGLPLKIFNNKCLLIPYFSVQHLDLVIPAQGFLAGTSNPLIKTLPKVNWDILIDIDNNSMQIKNDSFKKLLALSKQDKEFINGITQSVKSTSSGENLSWKNIERAVFSDVDMVYEGSEDWIMQKFYNYLKNFLTELELFRFRCSKENIGPALDAYNLELEKKFNLDNAPKGSPGIIRSGSAADKKFEDDIFIKRKQSSDSDTNSEDTATTKKEEADTAAAEERKEPSEDASKEQPNEEEEKVEKRERLVSYDESREGGITDPKTVLRREFTYLKETIKALKPYGIEWILEWTKTKNFRYWLLNHEPIIGQRSVNAIHARNHLWYYENGHIYFGDLKAGKRHGRGQFVDRASKLIYRGDWDHDTRNGEGTLSSMGNNDFLYDGHFKQNKKEGYGRLIQGEDKYVGTFKNDRFEGNGVLVDKHQNIYEGEFRAGRKWGMGKLQLANGDVYTGEFAKDLYHGRGQIIYKNGDIYSGQLQEGKTSGQGFFQFASGDLYEGQFKDNAFNGHGTLKQKDKYSFEGEFENGKLIDNEMGIIEYPDGSRFDGVISDYKANGYGVLEKKTDEGLKILKGRFEHDELVEELKEEPEVVEKPQEVQDPNEMPKELTSTITEDLI